MSKLIMDDVFEMASGEAPEGWEFFGGARPDALMLGISQKGAPPQKSMGPIPIPREHPDPMYRAGYVIRTLREFALEQNRSE